MYPVLLSSKLGANQVATFNVRYSSNKRTITTGAEIAQILRKAADRFEPVKFFRPEVDEGQSFMDEGFSGKLSLRGFLDPKPSD
jgi:hypothetical protein